MIFSVEKINGEMVVRKCRSGHYRASSAEEIKRALTEPNYIPPTAKVRMGKKWQPLKRTRTQKKKPRIISYSMPTPIRRGLTTKQKILKALRLYKDPLEKLIYKGW